VVGVVAVRSSALAQVAVVVLVALTLAASPVIAQSEPDPDDFGLEVQQTAAVGTELRLQGLGP
jgi:hypothetical protein